MLLYEFYRNGDSLRKLHFYKPSFQSHNHCCFCFLMYTYISIHDYQGFLPVPVLIGSKKGINVLTSLGFRKKPTPIIYSLFTHICTLYPGLSWSFSIWSSFIRINVASLSVLEKLFLPLNMEKYPSHFFARVIYSSNCSISFWNWVFLLPFPWTNSKSIAWFWCKKTRLAPTLTISQAMWKFMTHLSTS